MTEATVLQPRMSTPFGGSRDQSHRVEQPHNAASTPHHLRACSPIPQSPNASVGAPQQGNLTNIDVEVMGLEWQGRATASMIVGCTNPCGACRCDMHPYSDQAAGSVPETPAGQAA